MGEGGNKRRKLMQRRNLIAVPCAALLLNALPAAAAVKYSITSIQAVELGTLGGDESVANDINDLGQIVGWARNFPGTKRAFLYRNNTMQDITTGSDKIAEARGINNLTQIVGNYRYGAEERPHAFYWDELVQFEFLDEEYPDQPPSQCTTGADAAAINDSGVIAGTQYVGCHVPFAEYPSPARWLSYTSNVEQISHPKPDGYGLDINATGAIAGYGELSFNFIFAGFLWNAGIYTTMPTPLGAPQPVYTESQRTLGMNDSGVIVGEVATGGGYRAIKWGGSSIFSSVLTSSSTTNATSAREINNQGFIVGTAYLSAQQVLGTRSRAMVWHADTGLKLLPLPTGAYLTAQSCEALSVNNRSSDATDALVQAVGFCKVNGKHRAMLWNIQTTKLVTP
jgi:probable HAF family extracellular repeat protein